MNLYTRGVKLSGYIQASLISSGPDGSIIVIITLYITTNTNTTTSFSLCLTVKKYMFSEKVQF